MTTSPDRTLIHIAVCSDSPLEFHDVQDAVIEFLENTKIQIAYADALMASKQPSEASSD